MADQISTNHKPKPHAIMISVPYQGHINPFVNLALKLASKGLSVTFVHLEYVHRMLSKSRQGNNNDDEQEEEVVDFFSEARESGLDIRYTTIRDGAPLEFDRNLHFEEYWKIILDKFAGIVDEFVGEIIKDSDPSLVHLLVTDTVYPWPSVVAEKHNIVNVSFWTQPAIVFSLMYHWDLLTQNGHFPLKDDVEEEIRYVPGVKSINTRDLMTFLKEEDVATSIIPKSLSLCFEGVKKADFILINTVEELEPDTLSVLNKYHPTYAIGPINFSNTTKAVTKSLWPESDCTHWLDSKPPGSVLYVTFGSFVHTSKKVIEEIAYGLLHSGVSFIWAIRSGILETGGSDVLPDGFQDEIKDRGLIIPWCNQISVLSNPAVGGFMTHNGWNSTVESMWCGVPMICNPVAYDQVTNRKLVADDWKIGIRLCGKPLCVDRREVAEKIKSFMSESNWNRLKEEAGKVKETLHHAMEIDGSSEKNFDKFIEDLEAKIRSKSTSSIGKKID